MVLMKKFGREIPNRLNADVAGNHNMLNIWVDVGASSIFTLQGKESVHVRGHIWEVNKSNVDNKHGPNHTVPNVRIDVTVPHRYQCYHNVVKSVMDVQNLKAILKLEALFAADQGLSVVIWLRFLDLIYKITVKFIRWYELTVLVFNRWFDGARAFHHLKIMVVFHLAEDSC